MEHSMQRLGFLQSKLHMKRWMCRQRASLDSLDLRALHAQATSELLLQIEIAVKCSYSKEHNERTHPGVPSGHMQSSRLITLQTSSILMFV